MADSFRMDMSGDKAYREDALDDAKEVFGENTRSNAVVRACEHARRDERAKMEAVQFLARHVEPEIVQEVVRRLSTPQLPIVVEISYSSDPEGADVTVEIGE